MKYLIFGNGWIGNTLKDYLGDNAHLWEGDINDFSLMDTNLFDYDVWINTAAKTNIDWCEKNKGATFNSNVLGAWELASQAKNHEKKYVFISSGCIFQSKDINDIKYEDDIPNPQCWYAWTKAIAEQLILEANPDALIFRPRLPLSEKPHPRNTINKLLSYQFLNDNQESVDIVEDMIPVMIDLIKKGEKGIFHLANAGTISPAEIGDMFGHKFFRISKEAQDERLKKEGRAKRVTTHIGSKRIPLLPDIKSRMPDLVKKYKEYVEKGN